jgi:DoxX-like protein
MASQVISTRLDTEMTLSGQTGVSKTRIWAGRGLSTLAVLFMTMDGGMKLFKPPFVVQATVLRLGYPESAIVGIGVALLACTVLYVIPRTALLGAILLTAYMGGAVASNIRAGTPAFNIVVPALFAFIVWASLVLRNRSLEQILFKGE